MSELRDKAIAQKVRRIRAEAQQLERISRHRAEVAALAGAVRRTLDKAA